jgi:hypothetical protein
VKWSRAAETRLKPRRIAAIPQDRQRDLFRRQRRAARSGRAGERGRVGFAAIGPSADISFQ